MNSRQRTPTDRRPWGLALCAVLLFPVLGSAGTITLKNEAGGPVVIQAVSVVRGVLVRNRPYLLKLGDSSPGINLPGNKTVYIYDARVANRLLHTAVVADSLEDLHFAIVPDILPTRLKLEARKSPTKPAMRP